MKILKMNASTLKGPDSFDFEYIDNDDTNADDDKMSNDDDDTLNNEDIKDEWSTLKGLDSFDSSLSLLSFSNPSCCGNQLSAPSKVGNEFHVLSIIDYQSCL